MKLKSPAFQNQGPIPSRYSGEGSDISPPFSWSVVPEGTKEFVLICEDPDAPKRTGVDHPFAHWVIFNISPSVSALPEGLAARDRIEVPVRADQGKNSFGQVGYGGPMPPEGHGVHHYHFKLFALNTELAVPPGATRDELTHAMRSHILDSAEIVGTYERKTAKKTA